MTVSHVVLRPSNISKTLICIDSFHGTEFNGRLFNPYVICPVKFSGSFGMVKQLEKMMDYFSFPEPTFQYRTFRTRKQRNPERKNSREVHRCMSDDIMEEKQGERATFVVQVQFRQNATWQGTIQWLDQKKSQRFRSVLEMIKLMDQALSEEYELEDLVRWELMPDKAI
ncbi:hypothetical protein V6615_05345 [Oscillospiraceae bacterium PP1C4]